MDTSTKWVAPVYRVSLVKNLIFTGILVSILLIAKQNFIFILVFSICTFTVLQSINPKKHELIATLSFSKNMATHYITEKELKIEWKNKKKVINLENISNFKEDVAGFETLRNMPICKNFDRLCFSTFPGLEYIIYVPKALKNDIVKELSKHVQFVSAKRQLKILKPMIAVIITLSIVYLLIFFYYFKYYIH
ncbi:MAG TPA: hypothetical protein PKL13_02800 [bacterium]|nr:hypothetical protein [bacterium]